MSWISQITVDDTTYLTGLLQPDCNLVVVTGAGISVASGIPSFRGPDEGAVWANDVMEKATLAFFHRNPAASWAWYLDRFSKCWGSKPNPAHFGIQQLTGLVPNTTVVTQNIDGLHKDAGQANLIEVHGAARLIRCTRKGLPNCTVKSR